MSSLLAIPALLMLALAAFGFGRPVLRVVGVAQGDWLAAGVWGVAVGLLAASLALAGLALCGAADAPVIAVLTIVGCLSGVREIVERHLRARADQPTPAESAPSLLFDQASDTPWAPPRRWLWRGIFLATALTAAGSLLIALAPPCVGDVAYRHLEPAKRLLMERTILGGPYHDYPGLPGLVDMLYLWALGLAGGAGAPLVGWGLGVLLALAGVLLADPIVGRRWAWLAGALVALAASLNQPATVPPNCLAMAAMTTLSVAAWRRAALDDEPRRWLVVAGLCMAGALAAAPIAILFAAAWTGGQAALGTGGQAARGTQRRVLLCAVVLAAVVATAVVGFRHGEATTSPWQLPWGALALAALPGVLIGRRLRGLGTLLGIALGYALLCFLWAADAETMLPAVPLLTVAAVWVWIEMRRFPARSRWVAAAGFGVILVATALGALRCGHDPLAVAVRWEDRERYLTRYEPTYPAAAVANELLSADARVLSQEECTFYFDRRVTSERAFRRCTHYDEYVADPARFSRQLQSLGFTHLLLAEAVGDDDRYNSTLSRLAGAQLATSGADLLLTLTEYRHRSADGVVRRYRLLMLR